jgi:hypothetical protein
MELVSAIQLQQNEQVLVRHKLHPELTAYKFGPCLVHLEDPWQEFVSKEDMKILDQDDFIIIREANGTKRRMDGAAVYRPVYGEEIVSQSQSIQVPVNHYLILFDQNDTHMPEKNIRGPCKFYPEPFQTVKQNNQNGKQYFPCIEVTTNKAIHLQKADGKVLLVERPQFYMPEVGEKVLAMPERTVLLMTDFCMLKSPDGEIFVMNGRDAKSRAFFIKPFCKFVTFTCDGKDQTILSTLPLFLSHAFNVLTRDNVTMKLDCRVSYQIKNVDTFASNPIEFYTYIRNHVQNVLLDKFAQKTLREFMASLGELASGCVAECAEYFMSFGIDILDIQILNYSCTNAATQKLLTTDIHTNVTKQNELRARQNDIAIQAQANKVQMKQKDLEVEMSVKDNEVALQKKTLENSIRLKEMEIEIQEERKRRELLEVKRENDLVEAEFEGRAKGHELREFLIGVDPKLTADQKIALWKKQCDLKQAEMLYSRVPGVTLYPADADLRVFQLDMEGKGGNGAAGSGFVATGILQGLGAAEGAGTN